MKFDNNTPRSNDITIGAVGGIKVPQPWKAGDTVDDGAAHSLNQTIVENVRNNLRLAVKELADKYEKEGRQVPVTEVQGLVDEYCRDYEFGRGAGGFRASNPIEAEAMDRARKRVKNAMLKKNIKLKDVTAADITAKAKALLAHQEHGPKIWKEAERFVKEQQKEAENILDSLV